MFRHSYYRTFILQWYIMWLLVFCCNNLAYIIYHYLLISLHERRCELFDIVPMQFINFFSGSFLISIIKLLKAKQQKNLVISAKFRIVVGLIAKRGTLERSMLITFLNRCDCFIFITVGVCKSIDCENSLINHRLCNFPYFSGYFDRICEQFDILYI